MRRPRPASISAATATSGPSRSTTPRPRAPDLVRALAERSDVLIENFRSGVLDKYGLGYEALHQLNPNLIYCSITGYGQDGPYADRPGYDGVFQAMSGMMSVSGLPDGEPGAGPMKVGISMIDILTGLYAGNAILAALRHREIGGASGQHIDLSLLDCGVASLSHYAQNYLVSGEAAPRRGTAGSAASRHRPSRAPMVRRSSSWPAHRSSGRACPRSSDAPNSPTTNGSRPSRLESRTGISCFEPYARRSAPGPQQSGSPSSSPPMCPSAR